MHTDVRVGFDRNTDYHGEHIFKELLPNAAFAVELLYGKSSPKML